jgi:hypothetical protein
MPIRRATSIMCGMPANWIAFTAGMLNELASALRTLTAPLN